MSKQDKDVVGFFPLKPKCLEDRVKTTKMRKFHMNFSSFRKHHKFCFGSQHKITD